MNEHMTFGNFVAQRHEQSRELYTLFVGSINDPGVEVAISTLSPRGGVVELPSDEITGNLEDVGLIVCNLTEMDSESWRSLVVKQRVGRISQTDLLVVSDEFTDAAHRIADAKIITDKHGSVDAVHRIVEKAYENKHIEIPFGHS